jgi:amphi-Trp domain-containing protein
MKTKNKKERDEERLLSSTRFAATLRRVADALGAGKPVVIQVKGERVRVPANAELSIEHEREGGNEELELQLKWKTAPTKR